MKAEILDLDLRFEVAPAVGEGGTLGPPARLLLSVRPCWKKPPLRLELAYVYEALNVAYYQIVERG